MKLIIFLLFLSLVLLFVSSTASESFKYPYSSDLGQMSPDQTAEWICSRYQENPGSPVTSPNINNMSSLYAGGVVGEPRFPTDGDCPDSSFTLVPNINANLPNVDSSQIRPGCMQLKDYPFCYLGEDNRYHSSLTKVNRRSA